MASTSNTMRENLPSRDGIGWLFGATFLGLSFLATYFIRIVAIKSGVSNKMENIAKTARFSEHDLPLRTTYTGITLLDNGLAFLVAAFMNGAAGWDRGFFVLLVYFLLSFFPIVAIWAIESCRKRNSLASISFTSIWALFYQTVGGAIVIPLYYLAYLRASSGSQYWSKESRPVPMPYAKALLPALVLGYLVPTILMFLPYSDENLWTTQAMVALWQPCPWFVDALLWLFSMACSGTETPKQQKKSLSGDIEYLDSIYSVAFVVAALSHVGTALVCLVSNDPQHSFSYVFMMRSSTEEISLVQGMHAIFKADFWIIFVASLVWAFLAVWDCKRSGLAEISLGQAALAILIGAILVGPAATVTGVWYWREHIMVEESSR